MDHIEKKLLDIFNYYNRVSKPFKIEKIHVGHNCENCTRNISNLRTERKIKSKIFKIVKYYGGEEESHSTSPKNFSLDEFITKINSSSLLNSDYNYEKTFEEFKKQLTNSVFCISTSQDDFQQYYVYFHEKLKTLNEEFKEKINFWKDYFNLTNLDKGKVNRSSFSDYLKK
jgi:hypothetical protein